MMDKDIVINCAANSFHPYSIREPWLNLDEKVFIICGWSIYLGTQNTHHVVSKSGNESDAKLDKEFENTNQVMRQLS